MKQFVNLLISTKTTIALLLIFALSTAWATFLENDFGSDGARSIVYNAKWFEFLLLIGAINLIGIIIKLKLYRKEKLTLFLFHISFVIIILGAGITRYLSKEGYMHLREGQISNSWYTAQNYVNIKIEADEQSISKGYPVLFSGISNNRFSKHLNINHKDLKIQLKKFLPNATETVVESPDGSPFIHLVEKSDIGREDHLIGINEDVMIGGYNIRFSAQADDFSDSVIILKAGEDGNLQIKSPIIIAKASMSSQTIDSLSPGIWHSFDPMTIYYLNSVPVVLKKYMPSAKKSPQVVDSKDATLPSALIFELKSGNESEEIYVWGQKESVGVPSSLHINGLKVSVSYGSNAMDLPFSLKLNDFIIKRYSGSNSPSWFESNVTLHDNEKGINSENRIYMNHILRHRGFRFYQASYDMDEKGSILSINNDWFGTTITYFGYILLALGMALSLINRNSRFRTLDLKMPGLIDKTTLLLIGFFFISVSSYCQEKKSKSETDLPVVNENHAELFGKLLVQDNGGRIEPVNTLTSEVLRKVARKDKYKGQTPDQVMIGMMAFPEIWQNEPMIKIGNDEIKKILGIDSKYAAFNDFFKGHMYGGYILKGYVEEAHRKKPAYRSKFDNEIIRVDERLNICYLVYTGSLLKLFPDSTDLSSKWYASVDNNKAFKGNDSVFVNLVLTYYLEELNKSVKTNDWQMPDKLITSIKTFQEKYTRDKLPIGFKVKAEYQYNKSNIFAKLTYYYLLIGFVLLIIQLLNIFIPRLKIRKITIVSTVLIIILFLFHTTGLAFRWYISGHAPWSNGYEALVFIAWAAIIAGLLFGRNSGFTISTTAILAGLILETAHLSWMDPQVTNLVPVLKSYWLVIHVAVITASYGFVGLGALLAFINLIFMSAQNKKNNDHLQKQTEILNRVIEKTLIVGLYMLTIGCFLGGVWANESWGRYWGWDPKETWALITIIVYAIILHVRLVPGLKGKVLFNILSLMGFASVLMTYFGVNYYLSGLHSYAKGDPLPVPPMVYYSIAVVLILSFFASLNQYNLRKSMEKSL